LATVNKRYNCPFCPGFGKRNDDLALSVNWEKGVYHCFRCGTSGQVNSLPSNFSQPLLILREDREPREQFNIEAMTSLTDSPKGKEYLRQRGLNPEPLERFVFVSGRKLIFPFYDSEGDIVYYVARKMWGGGRRYDNMRAVIRDIYIPPGSALPAKLALVVTEGIFDALSVWQWLGIVSVALLGMNINAFKVRRILECTQSETQVLILLDAGEYQTALSYYNELSPLRKRVRVVKLEKGDPNEIGREKLWKKLMPYLSSDAKKTFSSTS